MSLPLDLIDLLAEFADAKVEYLIVGGQAVALHGHPRFTKDADIWIRDSADNISRCQQALIAFGAPKRIIDLVMTAQGLDVVWMGHPPSRIDLLKAVPGGSFEEAWQNRETMLVDELAINVVSLRNLIHLKRASGRPQDLIDAELLEGNEGG